jgi:hypothetical protein
MRRTSQQTMPTREAAKLKEEINAVVGALRGC